MYAPSAFYGARGKRALNWPCGGLEVERIIEKTATGRETPRPPRDRAPRTATARPRGRATVRENVRGEREIFHEIFL